MGTNKSKNNKLTLIVGMEITCGLHNSMSTSSDNNKRAFKMFLLLHPSLQINPSVIYLSFVRVAMNGCFLTFEKEKEIWES
jgi:hypothetical protein